jgi:carboxypeptidase D
MPIVDGALNDTKTTSATDSLYFYLWGKDAATSGDELVVWVNGGPGCSALGGLVQENGPFLYESVKAKPYVNSYSWTKAATMLYVEQPIGTGFTTGAVTNTNEDQVAAQFAGFLDNFYKVFPELASKKLYITGESYAGE